MNIYFADRQLNILGTASTELPKGLTVNEDEKTEDVETGVAVFECKIPYNKKTRALVDACTEVGNYILRSNEDENEFYTIIDTELDTKNQEIYLYAEDAGLDLLNEIVGAYEADKAYSIADYINKYAADSGFEIGINEAAGLTRKLSWDGEATVTERIASVATQFGGFEISYTFDIKGLEITRKYINIYKERGQNNGVQLRLNHDVDRIVRIKSIGNLATALECTGGVPENKEDPITLNGYKYDDGNFYVSGTRLYCREALKKWSRYNWAKEPNMLENGKGHIVKPFSYDTIDQATLCAHAVTELKKISEVEVNYDVELVSLPKGTKVGDWVSIVDDEGELYVSSRILQLKTSVAKDSIVVTLGEFLIRKSGISEKVAALAEEFAKSSASAARAAAIANNALDSANAAQNQVDGAITSVEAALAAVEEASATVEAAKTAATNAQAAADAAQRIVDDVGDKIITLETSVENAQEAADGAQLAADTAQEKAEEAAQSAAEAKALASTANTEADLAQSAASTAAEKAEVARSAANIAAINATTARQTADAAKRDAEQAQEDIEELADSLESITTTMQANFARKTDITEATASLRTQISQNAAKISSTASKVQKIDETANDAQKILQGALAWAEIAQTQADEASVEAQAAQALADEARANAEAAQMEADTAKTAADTAKAVAEQAETALEAAKADLETIYSRADASEEEIVAAQQAVESAQAAADKAKADASVAVEEATKAQLTADTAVANAEYALTSANLAASNAALAQKVADEAKGNAEAAQATANEAAEIAAEAQRAAVTALSNATNAQNAAYQAKAEANAAQRTADNAETIAAQAADNLAAAEQRLADVLANVDATAEEVAEAEADVQAAQASANEAQASAEAAQANANAAKAVAAEAQMEADNAKAAADEAQAAADEAQAAADEAKGVVDGLAVRTASSETQIRQNANAIELRATKEEVTKTLGDTNERVTTAESIIQQLSNCISMLVTDENGESLMTQTENGWTFSMKETADAVSNLTDLLETLQHDTGSTQATVETLQQAVSDHGKTLDYVTVTTYENEPCIELGESDSNFKLMITNTRIMFMNGANVPTYINTNGIVTQDIEVQGEIVQGGYVMLNTSDGGWGLLWKGVSS